MLINFFMTLKQERLPVSFTELFTLLECLKKNVIFGNVDDFYYLSRMCLVKDEKNFDKFDIAFAKYFENIEVLDDLSLYQIPGEWLREELIKRFAFYAEGYQLPTQRKHAVTPV